MKRRSTPPIHAVILAGGAGERFWPRSRRRQPKPLLRVAGRDTLLGACLARARRFSRPERRWLVCSAEHAAAMRRASGLSRSRVLVEPRGRNTGMAVAWAARHIAARDPDAVLAVLPADHLIPDPGAFAGAIRSAAHAAAEADVLVTLGVRPTRAESGYGYIRLGPAAGAGFPGLHRVKRFVEKPSKARARRFLREGGFLWNAGIFVWRARVILEEIERHAPELWRALSALGGRPARRRSGGRSALEAAYRRAPAVPIDQAVLERSRRVWTLPVRFRWSDVGSWASLAEEIGVNPRTSCAVEGRVAFEQAPGNLVWGGSRTITLFGVEGLAVIDSEDALLVTRLDRSADLRRVVARLKEEGRSDLT